MKKVFVLIFGVVMLVSLFGCKKTSGSDVNSGGNVLRSLSISQSAMIRNDCYSFSVYKSGDEIFLSAWCMDEDYNDINFDEVKIKQEDFEVFEELDKKYSIKKFILDNPTPKRDPEYIALDETTSGISASYCDDENNYSSYSTSVSPEFINEIYNAFLSVAKKYNG